MHFSTVFSAFVVAAAGITGVTATSFTAESITTAASLSPQNYYGAPIPPWGAGGHPGWYYGKGHAPIGVFSILDTVLCGILDIFPFGFFHCPKHYPPFEYTRTFSNLNCACQDGSYLTYGIVEVVEDCQSMCDSVSGCSFFNTYHYGNGGSQLSCVLFEKVLTVGTAHYCGSGIYNSEGYYRK
ncbi:hypothetical protein FB451DRAFT_1126819 [Mycena latifolia]|nr:hypothetical protein FB451DRAFT_1126819 [Mycena latifolia]